MHAFESARKQSFGFTASPLSLFFLILVFHLLLDRSAHPILKEQYESNPQYKRVLVEEIRMRNMTTIPNDPQPYLGKASKKDLDINNARCIFMTSYFIHMENPLQYEKSFNFDKKMFKEFYFSISIFISHTDIVIFIDFEQTKFGMEIPGIKFIKVDFTDVRYTINDYRYFLYLDYLKENADYDLALMADISDVRYGRDPFEFFLQRKEKLFTNEENDWEVYVQWMRQKYFNCYAMDPNLGPECIRTAMSAVGNNDYFLSNAGIFGGHIQYVNVVLEEMVELFKELKQPECNANMIVFGGVIHKYWKENLVLTGKPLHAPFRSGLATFRSSLYLRPNSSFVMYHK